MPTYPVINTKTKETQELSMTMVQYDQWRKDNPDWDRDWSQGCASAQEGGDWQNTLTRKHPGWNDVIRKAAQQPGSTVKPY